MSSSSRSDGTSERSVGEARERRRRASGARAHEIQGLRDELALYRRWVDRVAEVCEAAAAGDLEPRLLEIDAEGPLGSMLHGINHLLDLTDAFVREAGAALEHASKDRFFRKVLLRGLLGSFRRGAETINLATDVMRDRSAQLARAAEQRQALADSFEAAVRGAVQSVASHAAQLEATAESLAEMARDASLRAGTAQAAARDASHGVDSIATATEQLTASVGEIRRQTQDSTRASHAAVSGADRTSSTVQGLSGASQQIGRVVKMIQHIAGQTNLLALNATIEAARAGQAGKGFAVVASEVKNLSNQSAEAAGTISREIEDIQSATTVAVQAISSIGASIREVDVAAATISQAVREQGDVTGEISRSAQDAARGARDAYENAGAVSEVVASTTQVAAQLLEAARELNSMSGTLRREVDGFVARIRQD